MSKCPFWSTNKEKVNCYSDCPMQTISNESGICPFEDFLISGNNISFKESLNDELFYSQDRYLNSDEDDRVINY